MLQIPTEDAKSAAAYLLYAIRNIKQQAELPLTPYKHDGPLSHADHAMHGILEAAERLGIDLGGSRWGNEIDSTNHT